MHATRERDQKIAAGMGKALADAKLSKAIAEKGTQLGGPWSDHLAGQVWELRIRLPEVAARVLVYS
jgi:hypothetical protein